MKTTLDLPDDLIEQIKIRAVRERKPMKRLVADLLDMALRAPLPPASQKMPLPDGVEISEHGLPVLRSTGKKPVKRRTAQEIVAFEQEVLQEEDLRRAGLTSR